MDYQRYGDGEAQLAWLDETLHLSVPDGRGDEIVRRLIGTMLDELKQKQAPIGHLKFMIQGGGVEQKISITTLQVPDLQLVMDHFLGTEIKLLVNGRVEMGAQELQALVRDVVSRVCAENGVEWQEENVNSFHPGFPSPKHRIN
jgi:hypothetical protein